MEILRRAESKLEANHRTNVSARLRAATARQSLLCAASSEDWARSDLNRGPSDYESPALTAELRAHHLINKQPADYDANPKF